MKKAFCILLAALTCICAAGCASATLHTPNVQGRGKTVNRILNGGPGGDQQSDKPYFDPSDHGDPADELPPDYKKVDIDLTTLSSSMVYAEVYDMMAAPDRYIGKKVRMSGTFTYFAGENRYYFACLIADATACCAQGIEFVLKNERSFPEEYPEVGELVTIVGVFDTYYEGKNRYCQLINAFME